MTTGPEHAEDDGELERLLRLPALDDGAPADGADVEDPDGIPAGRAAESETVGLDDAEAGLGGEELYDGFSAPGGEGERWLDAGVCENEAIALELAIEPAEEYGWLGETEADDPETEPLEDDEARPEEASADAGDEGADDPYRFGEGEDEVPLPPLDAAPEDSESELDAAGPVAAGAAPRPDLHAERLALRGAVAAVHGAGERAIVATSGGLAVLEGADARPARGPRGSAPVCLVAVDPAHGARWLVSTEDGALHRTDDAGATWRQLREAGPRPTAVAIHTEAHADAEVWVAEADGSIALLAPDANVRRTFMTPDGRLLALQADRDGAVALVAREDGALLVAQVARGPGASPAAAPRALPAARAPDEVLLAAVSATLRGRQRIFALLDRRGADPGLFCAELAASASPRGSARSRVHLRGRAPSEATTAALALRARGDSGSLLWVVGGALFEIALEEEGLG